MSSIFLVVLDDPDEKVWNTLRAKWKGRHHICDSRIAFVAPEEITLAKDVMEGLGVSIKDSGVTTGALVVKWGDSRAGYWENSLWEWVRIFDG